jgi:hypothetical protein
LILDWNKEEQYITPNIELDEDQQFQEVLSLSAKTRSSALHILLNFHAEWQCVSPYLDFNITGLLGRQSPENHVCNHIQA